jgi:hypothetical protein
MDQDEMNKLHRGPSVDVFCQVSVHFGQAVSEEKISIEINQPETRIVYGSHVC